LILVAVDHLATEFVPQLNPNPETPFNQNYPLTNLLGNINCGQNVIQTTKKNVEVQTHFQIDEVSNEQDLLKKKTRN
jgi:hypothetical protein